RKNRDHGLDRRGRFLNGSCGVVRLTPQSYQLLPKRCHSERAGSDVSMREVVYGVGARVQQIADLLRPGRTAEQVHGIGGTSRIVGGLVCDVGRAARLSLWSVGADVFQVFVDFV